MRKFVGSYNQQDYEICAQKREELKQTKNLTLNINPVGEGNAQRQYNRNHGNDQERAGKEEPQICGESLKEQVWVKDFDAKIKWITADSARLALESLGRSGFFQKPQVVNSDDEFFQRILS